MRRLWPLLLLLIAACATRPPAPVVPAPAAPTVPAPPAASAIPAGKAEVQIYRRAIPLGPDMLYIFDGGRQVGVLRSGTFLNYYADPGPRSLKAVGPNAGSIPYATTLRAGQSYYFMVYFLGNQDKGDASFAPVDAATATKQMASLKPASP